MAEVREGVDNGQPVLWGGKPYYSLDCYLKQQFGEKVYKLALNGGMTCPNRDGTVGRGGCIFCSAGGSGDFAADGTLSVKEQIRTQKEALRKKKTARKYIAYFHANTKTNEPVEYLKKIFTEAIADEEVVILSIATRPDCLGEEVLELLEDLNRVKPVWVELGLQTMHEQTARFIRRGYELSCFERAVSGLHSRKIEVIVHTILGLPGEGREEILQTVRYLNGMDIQGIKLQLLHILDGTDLGALYRAQKVEILSQESYVELVIDCLEQLSPEIVVHRLTGDGPRKLLLAPLWSSRKRTVLNAIHSRLKARDSWQGKKYMEY